MPKDHDHMAVARISMDAYLQATRDAVWLFNLSSQVLDVNVAACRMLGYSREQMLQSRVADVEVLHSHEEIIATLSQLQARGNALFESRHRRADGQVIDVEVSLSYVSDDIGIAIIRDISSQRSLETRLQKMAEHLPGTIYQFQQWPDGRSAFPFASEGIRQIYDVAPEDVERDASAVFERLHPDDIAGVVESINRSRETLEVWRHQYRVVRPDGSIIWVQGMSTPQRQQDGSTLWHGFIHDISELKRIETDLREQTERLNNIIRGTDVGTWEWQVQTGETRFNDRWINMLGYTRSELEPINVETWTRHTHEEDLQRAEALLQRHFSGELPLYECELRMRHKAGHWVWILDRGRVISWTGDGRPEWMFGTHLDINDRKQHEVQLLQSASVFEQASEAIFITDRDGMILDVNHAFTTITGYSREEVLGQNPRLLKSGRHSADFYHKFWQSITQGGYWRGEFWNRRRDGGIYAALQTVTSISSVSGRVDRYLSISLDITEQKQHEARLEHIAQFDTLTDLPNRLLLADRLQQAMSQVRRGNTQLAVVYLDLDGFKDVNDQYGHEIGDHLLVGISTRLKSSLRDEDTLARIGGDEFVAILMNLEDFEDAVPVIRRLLDAAAATIVIKGQKLQVSASVGVTFYPQAIALEGDQLIRQADQAMYQAKQAGKNRYQLFDTQYDLRLRDHYELIERIGEALENSEFELYYQPKVNMASGEVTGMEALIRWNHPQRGLLPPALFLPAIDNHPLSVLVGDWVIETAMTQIEQWQQQGLHLSVSVNIDPAQLAESDFIEKLKKRLQAHPGVHAGDLELEVLESNAVDDLEHVRKIILECRNIGINFSLDDFGTGYSTLTYLKQLPTHALKIDQSFVRDMLLDPDDLAILVGVLGLAQAFRRDVIAEGVETLEHGVMLLRLGCELGQGYAIARPMPAGQIPGWLATWKPEPPWQHIKVLESDASSALFSLVEHRAWVNSLEKSLLEDNRRPPEIMADSCHLGQWLAGQADEYPDGIYKSVVSLHNRLHTSAEQLLRQRNQLEMAERREQLVEIHSLSHQLTESLEKMICGQVQ